MERLIAVPVVLMIVFDAVGPSAILLYTKRRSGSWRRAIRNMLLTATVVASLFTGIVGALTVAVQGLVRPPSNTYIVEHDPAFGFLYFAIYGLGFAALGLLYCIPVIGLWRLLHRRSFASVTRT